jgi:hypothetical protein
MAFPYDFGFIPSAEAEDGDPVDVVVLMDERAFPRCLLKCRVVGSIEGAQAKKKKDGKRNDRIVAIEQENHSCAHVKPVDDFGEKFVREIEEFFVNFHEFHSANAKQINPHQSRLRVQRALPLDAPGSDRIVLPYVSFLSRVSQPALRLPELSLERQGTSLRTQDRTSSPASRRSL